LKTNESHCLVEFGTGEIDRERTVANPKEILDFWLDEVGTEGWYMSTKELDATISDRFGAAWARAATGEYSDWVCCPDKSLALIILLDQFPRNMFRNDGRAFSSDRKALCYAKTAIDKGFDMRVPEPQRQFYYMPLMHSESLTDQERCVRLFKKRMPEGGETSLLHAKAHRDVIRRFGRFPYRNDALARQTTSVEVAYLDAGGYSESVRQMQA